MQHSCKIHDLLLSYSKETTILATMLHKRNSSGAVQDFPNARRGSFLRHRADYIGITGSVLCIIHCVATPILLLTTTLLTHNSLRLGFLSLDYVFIGVNILAVWSASRHTSRKLATALWCFLTLFAAALLFEDLHEKVKYVAYVASLGLVITHLANIRYCRTHHAH